MEKRGRRQKKPAAKPKGTGAGEVPEIIGEPPRAFFKKLGQQKAPAVPSSIELRAKEALKEISAYAAKWSEGIEEAMSAPATLERSEIGAGLFFIGKAGKEPGQVIEAIEAGGDSAKALPGTYCIAIVSPSSTTTFILVDVDRRIAVRETIGCLHDKPDSGNWDNVMKSIASAREYASRLPQGSIAVCDHGALKPLKIL